MEKRTQKGDKMTLGTLRRRQITEDLKTQEKEQCLKVCSITHDNNLEMGEE